MTRRAPGAKVVLRSKHLKKALGPGGATFLEYALGGFPRILPHVEVTRWKVTASRHGATEAKLPTTRVKWRGEGRRAISVAICVSAGEATYSVAAEVTRRAAPNGVGNIERTLDPREFDICDGIARRIIEVLHADLGKGAASLGAIQVSFDQHVVAAHLQRTHGIAFDVSDVLVQLRHLAERSYENRSLSFGLLIEKRKGSTVVVFPTEFFEKKRYRALSDGYRTAFAVNSHGRLLGLRDLPTIAATAHGNHFYPEWSRDMAEASTNGTCGIALTRQGDLLVFDAGSLRFTCRAGHWQYWNHAHVCNLLQNTARAKRVAVKKIGEVTKRVYRVALDVSFRRSGALFVLLGARKNKKALVIRGDGIGDDNRESLHAIFDQSLAESKVQDLPRSVVAELSSIDGGVVLDNLGFLLAYGAVLKTSGKFNPSEGSRTKAAISASKFGIAVKVSSDGDITFYARGNPFLEL